MSKISSTRQLATLACSVLLALAAVPSHAATVLTVGTIDLVEGCDFVFQGTPVARWVAFAHAFRAMRLKETGHTDTNGVTELAVMGIRDVDQRAMVQFRHALGSPEQGSIYFS